MTISTRKYTLLNNKAMEEIAAGRLMNELRGKNPYQLSRFIAH